MAMRVSDSFRYYMEKIVTEDIRPNTLVYVGKSTSGNYSYGTYATSAAGLLYDLDDDGVIHSDLFPLYVLEKNLRPSEVAEEIVDAVYRDPDLGDDEKEELIDLYAGDIYELPSLWIYALDTRYTEFLSDQDYIDFILEQDGNCYYKVIAYSDESGHIELYGDLNHFGLHR